MKNKAARIIGAVLLGLLSAFVHLSQLLHMCRHGYPIFELGWPVVVGAATVFVLLKTERFLKGLLFAFLISVGASAVDVAYLAIVHSGHDHMTQEEKQHMKKLKAQIGRDRTNPLPDAGPAE